MPANNLRTVERWIFAKDGAEIYTKTWKVRRKTLFFFFFAIFNKYEYVYTYIYIIFVNFWGNKSAREPPIATIVFSHGFGEHINRYNHVFPKFQIENIEVH